MVAKDSTHLRKRELIAEDSTHVRKKERERWSLRTVLT